VQFRRHCAGKAAPGELVCPGAPADHHWRRAGSPFVERFDVRVPHAAPGDATYEDTLLDRTCQAAVQDRSGTGGAGGCRGDVGIRLQHDRRSSQLPVPRVCVPGLGLKRDWPMTGSLRPMPPALALMVAPEEAC